MAAEKNTDMNRVVEEANDADAFRKIHPREYYRKFIQSKIRPDGRSLLQCRKTTMSSGSISTADGSCMVKVGRTTVTAGIKLEVGPPTEIANAEGILGLFVFSFFLIVN